MYTVALAGSTIYTKMCAESLAADSRFELSFALTPEPKPIGRKKVIKPNPVDEFFSSKNLPVIRINQKLDQQIKSAVLAKPKPDLLLVVDFGYYVPKWLLGFPTTAALNIHPSLLPRWRGSSPGQFVLLAGEEKSGVTLMRINEQMDQGPIIAQKEFSVGKNWTQHDYYRHSFELICQDLPQLCADYIENRQETPQPLESPTPYAEKLSKADGFVAWEELASSDSQGQDYYLQLERASRAYFPWPGLWTIIPTRKGDKKMKIIKLSIQDDLLKLEKVQIEGQEPADWNQIKNILVQAAENLR